MGFCRFNPSKKPPVHGPMPGGRFVVDAGRQRPTITALLRVSGAIVPIAQVLFSVLVFSACAPVGPDFVPPPSDSPARWHAAMPNGVTAEPADSRLLAEWWRVLGDAQLSDLMARAVAGNSDLKEARARLREARARRGGAQADRFPTVDATGSASKSRSSENNGSGRVSEIFAAGFDAAWELDVFGGTRRAVEAADAELAASRQDLRDVLVSLTAELALNYVEMRTYQRRLQVAESNLKSREETFQLARTRFASGLSDELAVQQAQYNLASIRSQIPDLETGLAEAANRLAVLVGEAPGALHLQLSGPRPIPRTPLTVAVGVPADALRQRPDVRAAEYRLAAQTARIGVATAELYPKFRLSGSIGLEASKAGELFESASRTWRIGPGVSWNLFDAGAIRRNIDVQTALQEQMLAQYEAAVLSALEEVENALVAYAGEQVRRRALQIGMDAADRAALLAQDQFKAGLVSFDNVLEAQRSLLSFQDQVAQSEGTVTTNLVRLYKALGGGWAPLGFQTSSVAPIGQDKGEF